MTLNKLRAQITTPIISTTDATIGVTIGALTTEMNGVMTMTTETTTTIGVVIGVMSSGVNPSWSTK
jgi:hypothetical protein